MMRRLLIASMATGISALAGALVSDAGLRASAGSLTIEALMDIRHPSNAVWSPDSRRVAFIWDRAAVQDVWVAELNDMRPQPPRRITRHDRGLVEDLFWSSDGSTLFFIRDGDLWQARSDGSEGARPAWTTPEPENGVALSPDGSRVAFSRGGDIWIRGLADGREERLTETDSSEGRPVWSPDGARLAFASSPQSVPRSQAFPYHGRKILFAWNERTGLPDVGIVSVADRRVVLAAATAGSEASPAWVDATRLSVERIDESYKIREVLLVDARTGEGKVMHRDVEETWFSLKYNGAAPTPSPDGRWIAVISDRDGWDQIYLLATAGGRVKQLTTGERDVSRLAWSADSRRISYDTDEAGVPGRKHLFLVEVDASDTPPRPVPLTTGRGTNIQPVWSPSDGHVLYQHTDPQNSADLFVVRVRVGAAGPAGEPARLTDSMPASVDRSELVEPQLVWYPSSDGKKVPASLFVPKGLERSRKHPAIVWLHPDGVNQRYDGWHVQRNHAVYYSFHQYLLQKGYVVLSPDFRTSTGYGKAWRQGAYRDLGGQDYRDVAAGAGFLRTLDWIDSERIGVWGLSGGGFLTLQALTLTPTLFRCGINVAGVTDFGDYQRDPGPAPLFARMGSREDNPAQYDLAAPIRRVDRIVRPLLVLAGTADTNVPYEQSVRLVDALLKAGKDVEFMMYPGEAHYFHREHVLRDAWVRVERFFDRHLGAASSGDVPAER